ncbi:type II toxin-antitoxin system VapC family toxin [Agromyces sp. H66]|uniref:type II toxin-antitoxin system VapC family toxin n=1 Tax=Agromyces sp. H66 TaxID=2529859 RepID=UPI0010AAD523|nr:type II toxin-antitoxin system VapC family toxin [Agromyces sp. H66]
MIAYLDTSAIIPLIIDEPGSARARRVWLAADEVVVSLLAYVEAAAALARAERMGRLDADRHRDSMVTLERLWGSVVVVEPREDSVLHAAALSRRFGLRGYDAVHCATAVEAASEDFVAVSGDRDLIAAWRELGLATVDTNGSATR